MSRTEPRKTWWSAAEIAAAKLSDLPTTKRRVNSVANRLGWRADAVRSRRRRAAGGGWEYHWSLFPPAARKDLLPSLEDLEGLSNAFRRATPEARMRFVVEMSDELFGLLSETHVLALVPRFSEVKNGQS